MTQPLARHIGARAATGVILIAIAALVLQGAAGCGASKVRAESSAQPSASDSPAPAERAEQPADAPGVALPGQPPAADATRPRPEVRVERVETQDGIVVLTGPRPASARDLGVGAYPGAVEQGSSLWVLRPPRGDRYLLAAAEYTTTASLDDLEQFYRKQLGKPEVRRAAGLLVLSRNQGSESIVVRAAAGAAGKPTTILVRRAIEGAPVTLEPWGPPEGPDREDEPPRGLRPPRRPPGTPISG